MRKIATELNPTLRVDGVMRLDRATESDAYAWRVIADVITGIGAITLFLSLAAIYAVMSYTVTRRTREIAVRVALGARLQGVVAEILRRPLATVAGGVVLGSLPVGALLALSTRGSGPDTDAAAGPVALLATHAIVMIGVCGLACIAPTLRALRVQPTAALREE